MGSAEGWRPSFEIFRVHGAVVWRVGKTVAKIADFQDIELNWMHVSLVGVPTAIFSGRMCTAG